MNPLSLVVFPVSFGSRRGLSAVVLDGRATADDLARAMQPWSDDGTLTKPYLPGRHGRCAGCSPGCCAKSLIPPDPVFLGRLAARRGLSPVRAAAACFDGNLAAAGFPLIASAPCVFLRDNLCSIYDIRPLVCRLFLCCPLEESLEEAVLALVAAGAAACRPYLPPKASQRSGPVPSDYLEEYRRSVSLAGDGSAFEGASSYDDVPLAAALPEDTWRRLRREVR